MLTSGRTTSAARASWTLVIWSHTCQLHTATLNTQSCMRSVAIRIPSGPDRLLAPLPRKAGEHTNILLPIATGAPMSFTCQNSSAHLQVVCRLQRRKVALLQGHRRRLHLPGLFWIHLPDMTDPDFRSSTNIAGMQAGRQSGGQGD
jgi:hypothetical protein